MKTILVLLILFSAIALPALGELTVEDIEKIEEKNESSMFIYISVKHILFRKDVLNMKN